MACLDLFCQLDDDEKPKATRWLLRIFKNILENPTETIYQLVNSVKIRKAFQQPEIFIDILIAAGFQRRDNQQLLFDIDQIDSLQSICTALSTMSQLLNDGFSAQEAASAVAISQSINRPVTSSSHKKDSKTKPLTFRQEMKSPSEEYDASSHKPHVTPFTKPLIFEEQMAFKSDIEELIHSGCTKQEAITIIKDSLEADSPVELGQMHMDDATEYLYNLGFEFEQSVDAITKHGYNHCKAFEYLTKTPYISQNKAKPNEASIQQIVNMGFGRDQAISSLQTFRGDVAAAVDHLLQQSHSSGCNGIRSCPSITMLIQELQRYNALQPVYNRDVLPLMDSFNHVLCHHNEAQDFEYIYDQLNVCAVTQCCAIDRHYRNRNVNDDPYEHHAPKSANDIKESICQILDKIHCFYQHSYDMGYRMRRDDSKEANENGIHVSEWTENKMKPWTHISKYHQLQAPMGRQNHASPKVYSFGQVYLYWSYYRDSYEARTQALCTNPTDVLAKWYVSHKYTDLKDEMINNQTTVLLAEQYQNEHAKALVYLQTRLGKSFIADLRSNVEYLPFDKRRCGIQQGASITLNHLIAVLIYCGYTVLQYEFSKTYRKTNANESDDSLKKRHCEFCYLGQYITETIVIFSKKAAEQNITTFYHGVGEEMIFDAMRFEMYQPFSTTTSLPVAFRFSNDGMIMELNCGNALNCFDCKWLSHYSNEFEVLFICGQIPFQIVNITHVETGTNYNADYDYVQAITMIDSITTGLAFQSDTDAHMITQHPDELYRRMDAMNLRNETDMSVVQQAVFQLMGYGPIPPRLKYMTIRLIKHELGRYGAHYPQINNIPKYIDSLLHNICIKKKLCIIRWPQMIYEGTRYEYGGHQAYLFLQSLLCEVNCPMIKLDLISTLFPNLNFIWLMHMQSISKEALQYILHFLSAGQVKAIIWNFEETVQFNNTHQSLLATYNQAFDGIGFEIDRCADGTSGIYVKHKSLQSGIGSLFK
eukprot:96858_1